jgi:flagellar hook assembly protein FlgD
MKTILWRFFALVLACPLLTATARANVYASDVKLDGSRSLVTTVPAGNLSISYILNEPATLGVAINITSGTNLIRTISVGAGANGTLRGSNLVRWDGNNSNTNPVPIGNYLISITASASGYTNWTQTSRDTDAANYVYDPRGIAVNNNSNSLFYGRVFIGSAGTGPNYATTPGDNDTILKLNADGAFSDDGPDGNGGFGGIFDDGQSDVPQKLRVADDDRLYMMDLTSFGEVVSFDMELSSNQVVLDQNNYIGNPFWNTSIESGLGWFSMDVTGAGTANGLIWLGERDASGAGVWNWHLINGVADTNDDSGNWAVAVGGSLSMAASGGLMVDTNLDIFVGQYLTDSAGTNPACMVFTNWNRGMAFNGSPVTNSTAWAAGRGDNKFLGAYDTTIDSRQSPKYVACALNGGPVTNGIRILNALTGTTNVANLDPTNQYYATAWDSADNLYAVTGSAHLLRVFSPPSGSNQATTVAAIQVVTAPVVLTIIAFTDNHTNVAVTFSASATNTAADFSLVSAPVITGPFQTVTNAVVTQATPPVFTFTAPAGGPKQFYEIVQTSGQ